MNHGHVKPRTWEIMYDKVRGGDEFIHGESTKDKWVNVVELSAYQAALDEIEKLRERVENAIYYQEKAKNFISHYEDCDAITNPDFDSDGVSCECGMDSFAHDNYLSIEFSKIVLQKSEARFPKEEK